VETNVRHAAAAGAGAAARAAGWALQEAENSPNMKAHTRGVAAEEREQAALLFDVFGNPFRPVTVDPQWLTSTVVALARGIYADRAFDRLPILADALQDAGCDHPALLDHCRSGGPHVRGCWVVDLLLGKEWVRA
jgi:hypothetical protein